MNTMNIDDLTYGQIKQLLEDFGTAQNPSVSVPYQIGQAYFIRTVTHAQTGRLVAVTAQELVLEDAAWVADSGRWADALINGELEEVEPFPDGPVIIGRGAVIDCVKWDHPLPRKQK